MSGRLCCYKQQHHSKLLAQFVFKASAFRFNTHTKTCAPLTDCRINNALIQFVPSCQDTRTQFVDVLDPPFSDIARSFISCLVAGIFMPRKQHSNKVLPFGTSGSGNYASPCTSQTMNCRVTMTNPSICGGVINKKVRQNYTWKQ